jgi:thymidylate synthase (FAD)
MTRINVIDSAYSAEAGIIVDLIQCSDITIAAAAIRKCTDSMDKLDSIHGVLGDDDRRLIKDCVKKGHESVFEHIIYTFDIHNISRALLQEISRHRIASPSVQSTRWALKKILNKIRNGGNVEDEIRKHLKTVNPTIDAANIKQVKFILEQKDMSNDVLKYAIPEAFLTTELFTINARSLWNLFNLRLSKRALKEFRDLSNIMLQLVYKQHPVLFESFNNATV